MAFLNNTVIEGNARVNGLLSTPSLILNGTTITFATSVSDNNAGLVTAKMVKDYISAQTITPSRSGNKVSWGTGWVTSGSSTGATTSVSVNASTGVVSWGTGWVTSGSLSLGDVIPDDGNVSDITNARVLKGYEGYDTAGNHIVGTIENASLSDTYYTTNTSVSGSKISANTFVTADRYIKAGATKNIDIGTITASSGQTGAIDVIGTGGWISSGTTTKVTWAVQSASGSAGSVSGSTSIGQEGGITYASSGSASGLKVTASGSASYSGYSVSTAGWIATGTVGNVGSTGISGASKYIESIAVGAGKTLAGITANGYSGSTVGAIITAASLGAGTASLRGGKITTLTMEGYSEITTLNNKTNAGIGTYSGGGSITAYSNTGTIGTMTGARTVSVLGTSSTAGSLTISTNTYGTVNVWGTSGDKTVQVANHTVTVDGTTVTNTNGDLTTTSLSKGNGYLAGTNRDTYLTATSSEGVSGSGLYGYGNVSVGTGWISGTNTNSNSSTTYYVRAGTAGAISGGGLSGGGLSKETASGGALSGGGLSQGTASGGDLTWDNSNVTTSSTNNGIRIKVNRAAFSQKVNRAAVSLTAFSQKVNRAKIDRAAASYSITTAGWISSAGSGLSATSIAADSTTVSLAANSIAADSSTVSLAAGSTTLYITGITVPSEKTLNVTNNGTVKMDGWNIVKGTNDLTFTYAG